MLANKKIYNYLILLGLLAATIIRIAYVSQLDAKVWWVDEVDYMTLGKSLAEGHGFVKSTGEPTAFRPPGYPLFLAVLYKVGITEAPAIRLVHVGISVLTIFLLSLLSLKIAGPVASVAATFAAAGYPYFVYGTGTLFAFTWFSMTLVASVYVLVAGVQQDRLWKIAAAGLLMGISILTRTSAVVLGMAVLLWLLILNRKRLKYFLVTAFVFGAAMTVVVAPWIIRNISVFEKPVLSTNGGRNLWLGNNPASTIDTGSDIKMPQELAERVWAASEIEADHIYTDEALKHIKAAPKHYAALALQKGAALWRLRHSPTTEGYPRYQRLFSLISLLSVAPLFLLAIVGYVAADDEQKRMMLLWIFFGITFTLLHALFISKVRFRLPLDFFLIVSAASAVAAIFEGLSWFNDYHDVKQKLQVIKIL